MLKAQLENPDALGSELGLFELALGEVERHAGHAVEATAAYNKAKQTMNELLRTQPDNAELLNELALAEAWLDDKAGAIAHIQHAIALVPASKDAMAGPGYEETLARIETRFGEKEKAIDAVEHLLSISYGGPLTPAQLRIDPDWDNLRDDPRFQKLAEQPLPQNTK
jgi:tetratricopeptide (TPR) repeat protein